MSGTKMTTLLFNKSLSTMVKGIRNYKDKARCSLLADVDLLTNWRLLQASEAEYISKCIGEIKEELKSTFPELKAQGIKKLIYVRLLSAFRSQLVSSVQLQMLGYDMAWASFPIIEVCDPSRKPPARADCQCGVRSRAGDEPAVVRAQAHRLPGCGAHVHQGHGRDPPHHPPLPQSETEAENATLVAQRVVVARARRASRRRRRARRRTPRVCSLRSARPSAVSPTSSLRCARQLTLDPFAHVLVAALAESCGGASFGHLWHDEQLAPLHSQEGRARAAQNLPAVAKGGLHNPHCPAAPLAHALLSCCCTGSAVILRSAKGEAQRREPG